ncbi:translation initiation factor IF-2-like isoform X3 [Panthera tigris]|uniref:translation initiation factor IF-2-like isoform X3 n=1 Tax=Panthera tigris TaxID=9694 RepID=UPI001C6FBD24|nr:translation initiation factor IF-2-like isoform X3 [Panthera tigris]
MWRHRRALPRQTPGGRRSARARGGAFPSPPKGGGAAPGAGYHGNRKARDRPPSAPQQVRRPGPRGVRLHRAPDAAPASTHRTQAPNSGAGTGQGLLGPSLRRARLCSLRSAPGGPRHPQSHPWVSGRGEGPVPLAGSSPGSGEAPFSGSLNCRGEPEAGK